jgi:hypothetical protein
MFVSARKMAFLGLLLACSVLLVILSGVLEFNTLFLLAGAAFFIGIAIRECGLRLGVGFFIAGVLLSFMIAPNKLHCITYTAMGLYLVIIEAVWEKLGRANHIKNRKLILWVIKYITFNIIFILILMFLPKIIYAGTISFKILAIALIGGQVVLFIFDEAYSFFQKSLWGKVRGRFQL